MSELSPCRRAEAERLTAQQRDLLAALTTCTAPTSIKDLAALTSHSPYGIDSSLRRLLFSGLNQTQGAFIRRKRVNKQWLYSITNDGHLAVIQTARPGWFGKKFTK